MTTTTDTDRLLLEQLTWHWEHQARPRLDGLTDEEYRWEPVPGAWNIRRREQATTPMAAGAGEWVCDYAYPAPTPTPVTTIAWRLAHVTIGCFGARAHSHFGGPPADYFTWDYPPDAETALQQLDDAYGRWVAGVRSLDHEAYQRPVGEAEGEWADHPMSELVLHINREAIHHLAEVALLRDLYAHRGAGA
jgi:hypothetical protein